MRYPFLRVFFVCLWSLFLCASTPAFAHEFFIKPEMWSAYTVGQRVPLAVYSTHIFLKGEEIEEASLITLSYMGTELATTANEAWFTHDGHITLKENGTNIIAGHRKPILWSVTPDGEGEGGREKYPTATNVTLYEKFTKLLLPVGGKTTEFAIKVGHKLEIVPIDNPLTAQVGDIVRFSVLLDGKPAMFETVEATYEGFSIFPSAWAFSAAPTKHGEASIIISAKGLWGVRVAVSLDVEKSTHNMERFIATLTFPVQ